MYLNLFLNILYAFQIVSSFTIIPNTHTFNTDKLRVPHQLAKSWDVGDDWSVLSAENEVDVDPYSLPRVEPVQNDPSQSSEDVLSPEDNFIHGTIDFIYHNGAIHSDPSDPPLFDTKSSFESYTESGDFEDEMAKEVGMLIRCNESPDDLNVRQGRKAPELTDDVKYGTDQLVTRSQQDGEGEYEMTEFFRATVSTIFFTHATMEPSRGEKVLRAPGVATWMTQCIGSHVGPHQKEVLTTISRYAAYRSGCLTETDFHRLYFDAVLTGLDAPAHPLRKPAKRTHKVRKSNIQDVWRDLEAHSILLPAVIEHMELTDELEGHIVPNKDQIENLMDECEILSWGSETSEEELQQRSSYLQIELSSDDKTPKKIRDGSFVFIDEESCIGCKQCAHAAPSTFTMLENGRARTYSQSDSPEVNVAVSTCPVNCMHKMSFDELKEMETARDVGDGRDDHQHMGRRQGPTPLFVSGIGTDANHKSSWYHYLKHKCLMSSSCPQRGCFDCPMYDAPGDNPNFKARQKLADQVRLRDKIHSGELDMYRNFVKL